MREFNEFFSLRLEDEARFLHIDVDQVLDDLRDLAERRKTSVLGIGQSKHREGSKRQTLISKAPRQKRKRQFRILSVINQYKLFLSICVTVVVVWAILLSGAPFGPPQVQPGVTDAQPQLTFRPEQLGALVLGTLGVIIFLTILYLIFRSGGKPVYWNPDAPRHFSLGLIAGEPAPRLDSTTIDRLADSMGYFSSQDKSTTLNIPATIKATVNNSGIPSLVYQRKKRVRAIVVLEDAFAESLAWNHVPEELAQGLSQRGIPVLFGKFYGSPMKFETGSRRVYDLEDLERDRKGYLILVFSDGKSLRRQDTFALEFLARWPLVAWMELREPRFWDESTALPAKYGLPIYPATADGLVSVTEKLLTEGTNRTQFPTNALTWQGLPPRLGDDLDAYVEELLGDSIRWAQSCSILQPLSLGLADALRREFHQDLPPERLDRLFLLPNTGYTAAGLRFSKPVWRVLRSGFTVRWSIEEQTRIQSFILDRVKESKPDDPDSLAFLTWEWTVERVRLGLEPEAAWTRLKELANTPLGESIRAEMEDLSAPGVKGSLWQTEKTYRKAKELFRQGQYGLASAVAVQGLKEQPNAYILKVLKYQIDQAMEEWGSTRGVSFREVQAFVPGLVPARARLTVNAFYPLQAKHSLISGNVFVDVYISGSGDVTYARSFKGPEMLRLAAAEAASQWKFDPATRDGFPVEYSETIVFQFKLI
ncbi:MAG TPA: energy transducer TonB [Pyrinomonadaceae bacterium]|nr:energy transducer TonB [Pyrinomonadaceae bacterium]